MGVKELRNAFSDALGGAGTCTTAFLKYERLGGQEWQFLEFSGNWADGAGFSIRSDGITKNGVVELAARATAETLLQQRTPPK